MPSRSPFSEPLVLRFALRKPLFPPQCSHESSPAWADHWNSSSKLADSFGNRSVQDRLSVQKCLGHAAWDHVFMQSKHSAERSFKARLEGTEKGRMYVVLPFDPEKTWGVRARYHVRGAINGLAVRGALEQFSKGYFLPLGPAFRRGAGERGDDQESRKNTRSAAYAHHEGFPIRSAGGGATSIS